MEPEIADSVRFVYQSPIHLIGGVEYDIQSVYHYQNKNDGDSKKCMLFHQCNFIVMCAVAIEAHLNWYYHFVKNIDVTERDEKGRMKYTIEWKIKNAPISMDAKGECKAIFRLRNEMVHPKYSPRDARTENLYDIFFMYLSFNTLAGLARTLLEQFAEILRGKIALSESQVKLAEFTATVKLVRENGQNVNWVELINTNQVGLPMTNTHTMFD